MAVIQVQGIEVQAIHGVNADEKIYPQPFIVDISIEIDVKPAAKTDDLANTVNYASLQKIAYEVLLGKPKKPAKVQNLIETLAYNIVETVHNSDERIISTSVTLHKPKAPLSKPFSDVSITLTSNDLIE